MEPQTAIHQQPLRSTRASGIALIACASLVVLASWTLAGLQLYADYQNRIALGKANITNLADVLSEHTVSNLEAVEQAVLGLASTLDTERLDDPRTAPEIHQLLQRRRIATPNVVEYVVTDVNNIVRHTASMESPPPTDLSDRPFVPIIKAQHGDKAFFASPSLGRFEEGKERTIVTVSYRLQNKNGVFKGGIHAAVSIEQLGRSLRALNLGLNSIVGVVHSDGTLLLRHPDPDQRAGQNYLHLPAVQRMLSDANATGMIEVVYPNGLRYQAYRRLQNYPYTIYIAAAEQDILAPWRDNAIATIIGQAALTLLIGFLTVFVSRALKRRSAIEQENIKLLQSERAAARDAGETRDEIARVFAATSDGIVIFDKDFRYIFANDAFERITGSPKSTFLGETVYERMPAGSAIIRNLEHCRATQKGIEYENHFIGGDGLKHWVEVRMFPSGDKISAYTRDVTERRHAEQKILEAQRMDAVGRLAGGLAHDFNNMLSVVVGNIEMLLGKLTDPTQLRMAEMVRLAAMRGAEVVSRLLSFARRQPLDPKPLNIATVIKDVQNLLRRSLPENVELEFVQCPGLWQATADTAQLDNALVNLVMNARDAMPQGGKITIEVANIHIDQNYATSADITPGQYVQIAVSDTGTGMPPDVMARAFEPFFTTKAVGKGTGLGLSMVYGFARQSGGHARIYSEMNHGTTVKMYLPRAPGVSDDLPTSSSLPIAPRGSETILMVEDNDMVREFVENLLTDLGYKVLTHADAESALAAIADGMKPDMLLSDIVLAGALDGRQLGDEVKKTLPDLPILYMSGYAENAVVHHGRIDAGVQLISKPFRRYDIATRIRSVLNRES